jgi:hypothetical protein
LEVAPVLKPPFVEKHLDLAPNGSEQILGKINEEAKSEVFVESARPSVGQEHVVAVEKTGRRYPPLQQNSSVG